MTPRPKVDADPIATATMERIGRDFKEQLQPPKARGQWGMFALALAIGYLAATLASKQNSEGPVASRLRSSEATPQATPPTDFLPRVPTYNPTPPADFPTYDPVTASARAMIAAFEGYKAWYDRNPVLSAPGPVGGHFNVELPDGRRIHGIVQGAVNGIVGLPFTGNRIGDARYVANEGHWYVWAVPLHGSTASWIDP